MRAHGMRQILDYEDDKDPVIQDHPEKSLGHRNSAAMQETGAAAEDVRKNQKGAAVVAYYWCRVCKIKTPATEAKSCDCGVTMCNRCWGEWDFICPLCDSDMS